MILQSQTWGTAGTYRPGALVWLVVIALILLMWHLISSNQPKG